MARFLLKQPGSCSAAPAPRHPCSSLTSYSASVAHMTCKPANGRCRQQHVHAAGSNMSASLPISWNVWTGCMPLVGFEAVAAVVSSTPAKRLLHLHTYTLLEGPEQQLWWFDFLPLEPTSPSTAMKLLTGRTAPGEVRARRLKVQTVTAGGGDVRLLGVCCHQDPLAVAQQYNRSYNKDLHLLLNNCSHYTQGLQEALLADTVAAAATRDCLSP